jgi:hypothetical protein
MFQLGKYYNISNNEKKTLFIGIGSVILLVISNFLHLIFNQYGVLNEYWGSLLIFLTTLMSFTIYFYFLGLIIKKKNNSLTEILIMLIYISLAVLIILFYYVSYSVKFYG